MDDVEPLPRSLIPLPDESLVGFLLRLSHRLDESPLQLAGRVGLFKPREYARYSPVLQPALLELPRELAEPFATASKLATATVHDLTLVSFRHTYPPVADAVIRRRLTPRSANTRTVWLDLISTKCCPLCLAGDGSAIQRRHGGAWKRQWHLPVVFACLEHNTFLHDTCPHCRQPVHAPANSYYLRMIPSGGAGLHPGRCRNSTAHREICAGPLDQPTAFLRQQLPELTPQSAALQQRLLGMLFPASHGPASLQGFAELLVLTALITAAWPNHCVLPSPPDLAAVMDAHVQEQEALVKRHRLNADGWVRKDAASWAAAPRSAPAAAALLAMASHCRDAAPREQQEILDSLLEHASDRRHPRWGRVWSLLEHCSSEFRTEVDHALNRRFPPKVAWTDSLGSLIPAPPHGYRAEHVPQEIPPAWFVQCFPGARNLSPISVLAMRRAASLQLVQAVTGSRPHDAAKFLGIPTAWLLEGAKIMRPETLLRMSQGFDVVRCLHDLAQHLADLPEQVDYRERRERFASWSLSQEDWQVLWATALPKTYPERDPERDALHRDCVSAYIWSQLTGSEWTLAPVMRPLSSKKDQYPALDQADRRIRHLARRANRRTAGLGAASDALVASLISPR